MQQVGKDAVGGRRQPLPIGAVVPGRFGTQVFLVPTRQGLAQGPLGFVLAALTVDVLQPVLQRPRSFAVQAAQQFRLPVVPGSGANGADVADGQNRQQVEPLLGLHRLCEIPHRAWIRDIALLRHIRHQQMIPNQPLDGIAFLWLEAQARTDLSRDLCPQNRVIL